MHELSVTQRILEIVTAHATGRVTDIYLVVGELSSYVDDAIQFYWDIISDGTPAKGAALHFKRPPALLECQGCGHTHPLSPETFACPACGSREVRVTGGDEFYVESIEVQEKEAVG
jgi:hydrogenase nickel incorporation protein HypA/HybF